MSGMSAYDNVMDLVKEQIAAMAEYRELLAKCQAENEALIRGIKYYADDQAWNSREIPLMDRGTRARKILSEVMG